MFSQLLTLVKLRLLLLRRMFLRSSGGIIAGILIVVFTIGLTLFCVGMAVAAFFGSKAIANSDSFAIMLASDTVVAGILLLWATGMLSELQRSDVVDFRKMLYLPVQLRMIFLLNFVVSIASPLFLFFSLIVVGATAGFVVGGGNRMLLMLPLAAAFYLALMAWTYHLRGLMAVLMENKRRRRMILTVIPIVFVAASQLPNLYFQMTLPNRHHGPEARRDAAQLSPEEQQAAEAAKLAEETSRGDRFKRNVILANALLPPGWLPAGVMALQKNDFAIASLCFVGLCGLAGMGLGLGYRSTYRFYTGATNRKARRPASAPASATVTRKQPLTSRTLPLVSDDTSSVAMASWLTAIRHPRIRIQLVMPMLLGFFFMAVFLTRHQGEGASLHNAWMLPVIIFWLVLNCAPILFNSFGVDPEGYQAFMLLPTPRHRYLIGKNLAYLPLIGMVFVVLVAATSIALRPPAGALVVIVIQFFQVYLSLCILGNFCSVYFPYRLRKDSMNTAKFNPKLILIGLGSMIITPLMMLPTAICYGLALYGAFLGPWGRLPWGPALSLLATLLTLVVYRALLPAAGRCLMAREQIILTTLLKERD